jgi:iron(III) transport system permease protein
VSARGRVLSLSTKAVLGAFLAAALVLPLCAMLSHITGGNLRAVLALPRFGEALGNSILAAAAATCIAIVIAWFFAAAVVRARIRFTQVFSVFVTLPMLIPSISHGMGLVILFGRNGMLTRALGLEAAGFSIYGFAGVVAGSVLYAFPVSFLMLADVLRYEDRAPYEAAAVLGIPRARQFAAITFPYLRKPLIAVVFATFTLVFTDYGVPLMIGGRFITLPVLMYEEVIGLLHFDTGSVIGAFLLVPAAAAFLFDLLSRDKGNAAFVNTAQKPLARPLRDAAAFCYCVLVCVLIASPVAVFSMISFVKGYPLDLSASFVNMTKTLGLGAGRFLANSLAVACGTALLGTAIAYVTAYCTARSRTASSRALHLVSITSLAVPGLVLGLSYVIFFKGTFFYGTLAILILVNTVHFLASPYLLAYNSLCKLNPRLEDVGATLGLGRLRILAGVIIPQTKETILEMLSYFFVNCMMTISAVSFLATAATQPVSLMITEFERQMFLEGAAFVSLLILVCNFTLKCAVYLLKRFWGKREG